MPTWLLATVALAIAVLATLRWRWRWRRRGPAHVAEVFFVRCAATTWPARTPA